MTDDNENENEPEWMSHDYKKCDCFPCAARYLFSNEPSEVEEVTQEHLDYGDYCLGCGLPFGHYIVIPMVVKDRFYCNTNCAINAGEWKDGGDEE